MEPLLREKASAALARGKLDCMIRLQSHPTQVGDLQIDPHSWMPAGGHSEDSGPAGGTPPLSVPLQVLQFPGIYSAQEESEEKLQQDAQALFDNALKNMQQNRQREGDKLATLVLDRLAQVEAEVEATRKILPELIQQQRDRITTRIADLGIEVDQGRLEQELVYMAQRADVDEELDRLEAHIGEVRRTLEKGGPCGRRLDFLMQELNREANTLSSKSLSATTTQNAVELKVLIEQMREQIQNIE